MKKNDKILIMVVFLLAVIGYITISLLQTLWVDENAIAVVSRDNEPVLNIYLIDGSYEIMNDTYIYTPDANETDDMLLSCETDPFRYCVEGALGAIVIEYSNNQVTVIEETSPRNLCRTHGPTNSPARPITCLPNRVSIRIEASDDEIDGYIRKEDEPWIRFKQPFWN